MPLDLKKVITQLSDLEDLSSRDLSKHRLDSTYKIFSLACENQEELMRRLIETQSTAKANFSFGVPYLREAQSETLDNLYHTSKIFSSPHITIATDGSQINPSAHEFTNACLINTGLVAIPYFESNIPVQLSSEPVLYSTPDEVHPSNISDNISEEDLISYERTLKEIEGLVSLAKKYISYKLPIVALLDGTLIYWHIEKFNETFIEHFLKRFSDAMHELKSLNIPVASFLSNSRSNDLINMLKIFKCPYESVNCKKHCANIETKNLPCNPIPDYKPVLDRRIIEKYMREKNVSLGTRTVLFKSNSKILNHYPEDLRVFFFYMNSGNEIARVELPSYVAKDSKLLDLVHNVVTMQCNVGYGYPVTLSEAHLQAVVNRADREMFYNLLREKILKTSTSEVKLSNKELKKRISFV